MPDDNDHVLAPDLMQLTANIASAYVSNNSISAADLPAAIKSIHGTLQGITSESISALAPKPAVSVKRSVQRDYIVCLEDGAKLKMLKRYLRTHYDMSPDDYRHKWALPPDYPMVAPKYAELRSEFAKKIGLGKKSDRTKRNGRRATT